MLLRQLPLFLLLILGIEPLLAQRGGVAVGYLYGATEALDKAVSAFNFAHPEHAGHLPVRHGFYASASYGITLGTNKLFLTPSATYWEMEGKNSSFIYPVRSHTRGYDIFLGVDAYPFASSGRASSLSFGRNFFFNLQAGVGLLTHELFYATQSFTIREENYRARTYTPVVAAGFGYDILTLPTFSFTPELRVGYMFPFDFDDLPLAYTGSTLVDFETKSARLYLQAGIAMRLHAKGSTYR